MILRIYILVFAVLISMTMPISNASAGKNKLKKILGIAAAIGGSAAALHYLNKNKRRLKRKVRRKGRVLRNRSNRRRGGSRVVSKRRTRNIRIQTALKTRGYLSGRADGVMGQKSRQAVREFQASLGHSTSGRLTAEEKSVLIGGQDRAIAQSGSSSQEVQTTSYLGQTIKTTAKDRILIKNLKLCDRYNSAGQGYQDCTRRTLREHRAKYRKPKSTAKMTAQQRANNAAAKRMYLGMINGATQSIKDGSIFRDPKAGKGFRVKENNMTGGQKNMVLSCDSGRTPTVYFFDYCQEWGYGMAPSCSYDTLEKVANHVCNN